MSNFLKAPEQLQVLIPKYVATDTEPCYNSTKIIWRPATEPSTVRNNLAAYFTVPGYLLVSSLVLEIDATCQG